MHMTCWSGPVELAQASKHARLLQIYCTITRKCVASRLFNLEGTLSPGPAHWDHSWWSWPYARIFQSSPLSFCRRNYSIITQHISVKKE